MHYRSRTRGIWSTLRQHSQGSRITHGPYRQRNQRGLWHQNSAPDAVVGCARREKFSQGRRAVAHSAMRHVVRGEWQVWLAGCGEKARRGTRLRAISATGHCGILSQLSLAALERDCFGRRAKTPNTLPYSSRTPPSPSLLLSLPFSSSTHPSSSRTHTRYALIAQDRSRQGRRQGPCHPLGNEPAPTFSSALCAGAKLISPCPTRCRMPEGHA